MTSERKVPKTVIAPKFKQVGVRTVAGRTRNEWLSILRPLMASETDVYVAVWFAAQPVLNIAVEVLQKSNEGGDL